MISASKIYYCSILLIASLNAHEQYYINTMAQYVAMPSSVKNCLYRFASNNSKIKKMNKKFSYYDRPIFRFFPALCSLAHCDIADLPTPIYRLSSLEKRMNSYAMLYLKDDGLSGKCLHNSIRYFGGNKIRKLEFLLGDALSKGARSVMTYGCIGSNHAVATAVCAKIFGLRCITMLTPQPINKIVKRNLYLMYQNDADIIISPNHEIRNIQTICSYIQNKYEYNSMPYFIPTGGSCPIGVIGFVNAAFELKEQIAQGRIPEPDYIYVSTGSCGTLAGLLLGVRAAQLKTKVIGIAIEPNNKLVSNCVSLIQKTNRLLHDIDNTFPLFSWGEEEMYIEDCFTGSGYGIETDEGIQAMQLLSETENIDLDPTYTAKAFAGLLNKVESRHHNQDIILFWHTFCGNMNVNEQEIDMNLPQWLQQLFFL